VELDDLFCPQIDFAKKMAGGSIEIEIEKCNSKFSSCAPEHKLFRFFSTKVFTTGVFYKKAIIDNNEAKFIPEVKVASKFTIEEEMYTS
jgi:hypothetical protein